MPNDLLDAMMAAVVPFIEAADAAPGGPFQAPALLTVDYYPATGRVHVVPRDADGRPLRRFVALGDDALARAVGPFLQGGFDQLPEARRRQALDAVNAGLAVLTVQLTRDPDCASACLMAPIAGETGDAIDVERIELFRAQPPETWH